MAAPSEKRAAFDQQRDASIREWRWWRACESVSGVLVLGCAISVRRRPLTATIAALSLFFVVAIVTGICGPGISLPMVILRVACLAILSAAIFAAFVGSEESRAA